MISSMPVFGVCGYSGSGKTTLLEAIIPALRAGNLRVAVIKHDCHGLRVDRKGKDSDRFFAAGADVFAQGPDQGFFRTHDTQADLQDVLRLLGPCYDMVLVEGHKTSPLARKIWLLADGERKPPPEAGKVEMILGRREDRAALALDWIEKGLKHAWQRVPVYAGVMVGGSSSRMGRKKHLLRYAGMTWIEHIAETVRPFVERTVLVGHASVPAPLRGLDVVCDVPGLAGPIAGMIAAMRWQPDASWLFMACDMPLISDAAVKWLLAQRRPGTWAILPRLGSGQDAEPLFAHYDFRSCRLLEQCRRPADMVRWKQVATPVVPGGLTKAWRNINTPGDVRSLLKRAADEADSTTRSHGGVRKKA
ncbi:MAG: molybdopterin-guanine dinucleotide biosynthesis protein B [Verrucomicrobia bacterium]|nr:molybdopterin-guanine dinucleotide biosynthesis protein B [Verrucomicrobiota bacterium]